MGTAVYNLGVVGLGEGRSILSAALQSEKWNLVSMCDINPDMCKLREQEFGFDCWTTRYEDLLEDASVDVIAIYTPDQLHYAHIKQALEAGKHVICTKPLLVSLDGAGELIELSRSTGKHVFVGQSSRFFEPMIRQRQDYEAGKHGELQTVEAHYITDARWFLKKGWSRQAGFSWMYNFMIHAVDLVRWYMPSVNEVMGFGRCSANSKEHGIEAFDSLRFLLRDDEGRIATASGKRRSRRSAARCEARTAAPAPNIRICSTIRISPAKAGKRSVSTRSTPITSASKARATMRGNIKTISNISPNAWTAEPLRSRTSGKGCGRSRWWKRCCSARPRTDGA